MRLFDLRVHRVDVRFDHGVPFFDCLRHAGAGLVFAGHDVVICIGGGLKEAVIHIRYKLVRIIPGGIRNIRHKVLVGLGHNRHPVELIKHGFAGGRGIIDAAVERILALLRILIHGQASKVAVRREGHEAQQLIGSSRVFLLACRGHKAAVHMHRQAAVGVRRR